MKFFYTCCQNLGPQISSLMSTKNKPMAKKRNHFLCNPFRMNWLLKIAAFIQCIGKWVWFSARKSNLQDGSSYGSSIRRVLSQCTSCLHLHNSFSLTSECCSTCTSKTRNNELWISSQESSGWRVWLLCATCICFIFFLLDSFWFKLEEAENALEA